MYRKLFYLLAILSLVGIGITVYLTVQHYAVPGEAFCNINNYLSCDIVNKSTYAEIFGIPVAILGLITYVIIFMASVSFLVSWKHASKILIPLTFFVGAGLLFSLYLTFVELFVLYAVCIFCIAQQIIILIIFLKLLYLCSKHRAALLFT